MNRYSTLAALKAELRTSSVTADDPALLTLLSVVSRGLDEWTKRHFYSLPAVTRYYTGDGCRLLYFPRNASGDIASITSLVVDDDDDGTYELTLVDETDYFTWPENRLANTPINGLELITRGTQLYGWPRHRRSIKLVGVEGYSNETESAGTLAAAITDAAATSATMAAGHTIEAGDTILIGSEQCDVRAVVNNTLTLVRGINGTTAATALINAAVTKRRYPRVIEELARMEAARVWRAAQTGFGGQSASPDLGGYSFSATYGWIKQAIAPFCIGNSIGGGRAA